MDDSTRLPLDLIEKICEELLSTGRLATLSAFIPCSRQMYDLATPMLYRNVTLTRLNASRFFSGLTTPPDRLRRRGRKMRSAPADISWERFKSEEFYLDWESIYESAPIYTFKSRREYLIWPNADAESGSEASDLEDDMEDPSLTHTRHGSKRSPTKLAWPHPTRKSHQRKLDLLHRIKYLHIAELPSLELSQMLHDMLQNQLFSFGNTPMLVSIGPKAFWRLVDWRDRHMGRPHPFQEIIKSISISHLCIQFPVIDQAMEIDYMTPRIVTNAEHLSRDVTVDQYTYLSYSLPDLVRTWFPRIARELCSRSSLTSRERSRSDIKSATIHNVAGRLPLVDLTVELCRFWYRPCSCLDIYLSNPVLDTACYNHNYSWERIKDTFRTYCMPIDKVNQDTDDTSDWYLIDFDWQTGQHSPMNQSARRLHMEESYYNHVRPVPGAGGPEKRIFHRRALKLLNSVNAEACIWCGKGQLAYEESTVGSS